MLRIMSHQGNANQNHSEIPVHTQSSGSNCHRKMTRDAEDMQDWEASYTASGNAKRFGRVGKLWQVPRN